MGKVYMIEGTRQGEYFHNFVKAENKESAIEKWSNAERFKDKVGKENFKKYRNITVKETDHSVPDDLIY